MKKQRFSKYAIYLVPAIMLFFFARNLVLSRNSHLDAWMGGGMQMFSSVDKMLYRVAGFKATVDGNTHFVNFRNIKSLREADHYLRVMPTDQRLQEVAEHIDETKWVIDTISGEIDTEDQQSTGDIAIDDIDLESVTVYKTHYDMDSNIISLEPINHYVYSED